MKVSALVVQLADSLTIERSAANQLTKLVGGCQLHFGGPICLFILQVHCDFLPWYTCRTDFQPVAGYAQMLDTRQDAPAEKAMTLGRSDSDKRSMQWGKH